MLRKTLLVFLMVFTLMAAMVAGTSFPILLLMLSLTLIALFTPSSGDEQEE